MDKSHDDSLNANGGSARPNPNSIPLPSSNPTPNSAASNQNSSARNNNVAFKSDYIGQWAAKQDNPFAEQNRKAAEKKAAQDAARKKALPFVKIGAIAAAVIAVIIVVVVVIIQANQLPPLPDDITIGSEGAAEVTDSAQKIFDDYVNKLGDKTEETVEGPALTEEEMQGAIEAVSDYFQQQSNRTEDMNTKVNLALIEMQFYGYKGQPTAIIKAAEGFDIKDMTTLQAQQYLGMLMNAAYSIGDTEAGNRYATQFGEISASQEANEGEKEEEEE